MTRMLNPDAHETEETHLFALHTEHDASGLCIGLDGASVLVNVTLGQRDPLLVEAIEPATKFRECFIRCSVTLRGILTKGFDK